MVVRRKRTRAFADTDAFLRERGAGMKCPRHRKLATLGILWADGRAWTVACDRECYLDWEKKKGKWACVVRVTPINIKFYEFTAKREYKITFPPPR